MSVFRLSVMATQQQAIPAQKNVAHSIHFLPTFCMMNMASAIAGISTRPAKACEEMVYFYVIIWFFS